jgi:hypothetical protein
LLFLYVVVRTDHRAAEAPEVLNKLWIVCEAKGETGRQAWPLTAHFFPTSGNNNVDALLKSGGSTIACAVSGDARLSLLIDARVGGPIDIYLRAGPLLSVGGGSQ